MMIKIKRIDKTVKLPSYAHEGDAGMDLYSAESYVLKPGERKMLKTGIHMAIPSGFVGLVWDKSGVAANHGIKTMAGVVDSGYRGEVCVVLNNLSDKNFIIEKNMKVAQMLIQPVERRKIVEVDTLDETSRGEGAWGSTGMK
ncbi:dUTP diphosphatase [Candidatus Woesearchaeota archaeon]|nr:dUTP diphosphatase [Candidatus Woesearchaeota archaeon]